MGTITAANSNFLLSITGLYTVPQKLQGYTADAAFDTEATEIVETVMGVDGILSAGYTPQPTRQTVMIMPDSPSAIIFEDWVAAMDIAQEVYYANAIIDLPSISRSYVLTNGVLHSIPRIPGTRKVLQGRSFGLTWEKVVSAPFG
jgi:hypothetical protein